MTPSQLIDRGKRVVEIEIAALQQLIEHLDHSFADAIQILSDTLARKGKIIVIGIGKSGNIGHKIAATLNSTGSTAVVLNTQDALHGDLGLVSDGDAVIALSYSGETAELLDLLPFIKRFDVRIIAITKHRQSTLSQHADITLCTPVEREACPLNLAPTSSTTAALAMGDALAMVLLDNRGFTEEDFARFHPGGSLGKALLTTVGDIMRTDDALAIITPQDSVLDAIAAMSKARTGACIIRHADHTLAGIFTHGDFARTFQSDPHLATRPIAELMTKRPITVFSSALAAEALKIIGENHIDDLVVLDPDHKVVGLVDSQDLARLKLI